LKKRLHNTTVHFDYLTLLRGVSEKKKRRRRRRRVEKRNKSFLYSY